jgi:hypothetical protein
MNSRLRLLTLMLLAACSRAADVERWGLYEIALRGPEKGNPFAEVHFGARFWNTAQVERVTEVRGFYDGGGNYRVRFMPSSQGRWKYVTRSNAPELDKKEGEFTAGPPAPGNHGPVRVARRYHFDYADGTPYRQIGTTCYAWTHQSLAMQKQTLHTLAGSPFNKLRMCIFPKRYDWNRAEPEFYAFEGKPREWDYERFNPAFWQHLEKCIAALRDLGIEADLILFHPYDDGHWGFDRMTAQAEDRYLRYAVARLAAYRNVWWSLANEWDFMDQKKPADFERFGQIVSRSDPFHHLLGIHNGKEMFDQMRPWITHASIQNGSAVEDAARAVLFRDAYGKPVVYDEVKYEGDLPRRWGNLSAEEMVHRFWQGTVAGTYVGHGETYLNDVIWWAHGGVLHGQSPPRLAFLRKVMEDGPKEGLEPIDKWQNPEYAGKPAQYYIMYLGKQTPKSWKFRLPTPPQAKGTAVEEKMTFKVEVLDTWDMTVTPVEGTFTLKKETHYFVCDENDREITLPGKPWMALRITRVKP